MQLQRRQFMSAITGTLAAALFPGASQGNIVREAANAAAMKSVRRVGEAYLSKRPAEADRNRLLTALRRDLLHTYGLTSPAVESAADRADMIERFGTLIKADFAAGHTIMLDGWLLSETECRLCALHIVS